MKKLILNLCVFSGLLLGTTSEAADKAKVVFISGKASHGCQSRRSWCRITDTPRTNRS